MLLRPQFILFGDSLTQQSFSPAGGWGTSLADAYVRKADVINRGYSGYNTRWATKLVDKIFPPTSEPPRLVTVFFGANDAAMPGRLGDRQHVPVPEYVQNLRTIISHLQLVKAPAIVLLTPPPVSDQKRIEHNQEMNGVSEAAQLPERTNAYTKQYTEACRQLASELQLPVLDLWTSMQQEPEWEADLLRDGLHFTPKGNAIMYQQLQALIDERFPELRVNSMPSDFPPHSDLDLDNLDSNFQ